MLLENITYDEIGSRPYITGRTVEHHATACGTCSAQPTGRADRVAARPALTGVSIRGRPPPSGHVPQLRCRLPYADGTAVSVSNDQTF